jgi:hypothetical protein
VLRGTHSHEVLARLPRSSQLFPVSETVTTTRRWNSFVCPECRCVFRVPQDHDGTGVVCPSCRTMLRLPGPDDELPPLVTPGTAVAEPIEEEEDHDDTESDETVAATRSDRTFVASLALAAVVLVGIVTWWLMPEKKAPSTVTGVPNHPAVPGGTAGTTPGNGNAANGSGSGSGDAPGGAGAGAGAGAGGLTVEPAKPLLVEIEATVKAFLEAPTREASLALVVDPAGSARKWDVWLAGETYAAPGFQGLAGDPITTGVGEGATSLARARTDAYQVREISLIRRDGELKVEWDSWVGWSEMTWEDFRAKKPAEPVLFRVQLSRVDYFNFDFRDEKQWASYRLDSQDGGNSVYGYVPRTGTLNQRVRPTDPNVKTKWALKLRYPPGATRDDQVLIDSVVAEGWLLEQGKE